MWAIRGKACFDVSLASCPTGCYNQANLGTPTCAGCLTRHETCELNRLPWQDLEIDPARIERLRGRTHAVDKDLDPSKVRAARAAADLVESGMVVGLGTGSTAALMVQRLGERREQDGLKIIGVPTSVATAVLANHLRIPLRELDDISSLDMNLDGADEVDHQFRMIKGRGGALLREKIVACVAARRVTIITNDKRVDRLGNIPIPVEVSRVGLKHTERRLQKLGQRPASARSRAVNSS